MKRPDKDLRRAYNENLSDYKDTVQHLFHFNAMVILGNGDGYPGQDQQTDPDYCEGFIWDNMGMLFGHNYLV